MKKRLRKKRHLFEYTHYGYSFECEWAKEEEVDHMAFWDKLTEWHESRGFTCGGGSNNKTIGWILDAWTSKSTKEHKSPTDSDRDGLVDWLKLQEEIKSIKATNKIDLWKKTSDEEADRQITNWKIEWSR